MRIWIVLPAYNEALNLPAIFQNLTRVAEETYRLDIRIIVIDDGSKDDTARIALSGAYPLKVELLQNEVNMGLAVTFMRGMKAVCERASREDIIFCMDADNSHLPGQIPSMIQGIADGRDVVIASRYRQGSVIRGVPFFRVILSRCMSILFQMIFPVPGVRDYSCGYRAYRAGFLKDALVDQGDRLFAREGFACMVGILLRLHKQNAIFGEVPLVLRYDQKAGASKMRVGSTILKTIGVLIRERISSA